jgi:hypothetical protein
MGILSQKNLSEDLMLSGEGDGGKALKRSQYQLSSSNMQFVAY